MMAQEIVIRPGKTLRFNLSINKSFNADELIFNKDFKIIFTKSATGSCPTRLG